MLAADTIDATRKSLPVYALREELLEAIADSQVLIVVSSMPDLVRPQA